MSRDSPTLDDLYGPGAERADSKAQFYDGRAEQSWCEWCDENDAEMTESRDLYEAGFMAGISAAEHANEVEAIEQQWAPDGWDLIRHLERQRRFSETTFGPGPRAAGVIDHIRKELTEVESDPADLEEWVDVVLLALDGAWRSGATSQQIAEAIDAKMDKNEARDWPDWREVGQDEAIEHIRKTCRACAHSYMEPDAPTLICGHPDAGSSIFGLHIWKEPLEHCGWQKFKQHPHRNPDGSLANTFDSEDSSS